MEVTSKLTKAEATIRQLQAKISAIVEMSERVAAESYIVGVARSHPHADKILEATKSARTLSEAKGIVSAFDGRSDQVRDLSEEAAHEEGRQLARGMERNIESDTTGGRRRVSESSVPIPGMDLNRFNRVANAPQR